MKISILTPTYNRSSLLKKLYNSIIINTKKVNIDIEWLIMDDGSNDDTKQSVESFVKEKNLDIFYFYEENKGKMYAINELVKKATGDFIVECDSDDFFTDNAFELIKNSIESIKDYSNIYGLVFLKYDQNGNNMGNNFKEENYESTMFDLYFKEGITGEKALVYNAKIRKQYKYELENNEKFITEARLHHKMDLKYKVRCFNQNIMICEYKSDGYTKNIEKIYKQNPYGYYQYFKEIFNQNLNGVKFKKKLYIYKHYILFSVLINKKHCIKEVKGIINKFIITLLYLPGKIVTKRRFKN